MNFRKFLRANPFFSAIYYGLHIDDLQVIIGTPSYMKSVNNALIKFNKVGETKQIIRDIKKAYLQCKASPEEYFLLDLQNADIKKRKSFVTDRFMLKTLGRVVGRYKHDKEIEDKWGFYTLAKDFFKRAVIKVECEQDYDKFVEIALQKRNLIIKPNNMALGSGIFAVNVEDEISAKAVFYEMLSKGKSWIVEEKIKQDASMAVWNESSVNTIRVLSFLNEDGFFLITPFLRTGRKGSVVDNAGAGGVLANVEYIKGVVESDGMDEAGNYYIKHPDSGVVFKGWQIPKWRSLVETVENIHKTIMPSHPYIGWDFALSADRGWCVIEANWGQFLNQYVDKVGRKEEFLKYVKAKPYLIR